MQTTEWIKYKLCIIFHNAYC